MRNVNVTHIVIALAVYGCPIVQKSPAASGYVVDSDRRVPLAGVRVTACMLDKRPPGEFECRSTTRIRESTTDKTGRFRIDEVTRVTFGIPLPGGMPAFATNVRFDKDGYVPLELHWWKEGEALDGRPLDVELLPLSTGQPN